MFHLKKSEKEKLEEEKLEKASSEPSAPAVESTAEQLDNSNEPEENVVSVWYGSGNTSWFRRRHFDGYTMYETLEKNGKKVMHTIYTGVYYTPVLEKKQIRQHRLAYIVLFLVGLALILFSSTRPILANIHAYNGFPQGAALFGFAWFGYGIINDFVVPKRRTIGDYRASSLAIERGALVAAIACALSAVVTLIYIIIGVDKVGMHVIAILGELCAAVAAFFTWKIESKVKYEEKVSELAGKYTM